MKTSEKGLKLLAAWEGDILHVYKDEAGLPTIGIGHLLTRSELASGRITIKGHVIALADGLTEQQSLDLLSQDLAPVEAVVGAAVRVPLEQCQFDALTIFCFNIGNHGFLTSSALKIINTGDYEDAANRMALWNKITVKGQHVVSKGLTNRRAKEIKLFRGEL